MNCCRKSKVQNLSLLQLMKHIASVSIARAAVTYRQESPAKEHFGRKRQEIILFGLSCRVFLLQIELCQNAMATQRYFLLKKKKRKMKTVGVSMKPRTYVKKLDEFFLSGNKRLNCRDKRVIGWRRYWLSQESSYEGSDLFPFFFFFFSLPSMSPTFAKP